MPAESAETLPVQMLVNRAYEITRAQVGPLFQTAFMLYFFIGNQLSIFTIFFMASMGTGPIRNLLNMGQAFSGVTAPGANLLIPKLGYLLINLIGVAVILYKLRAMGLLPITSADWISLLPVQIPLEYSSKNIMDSTV
jgi:ER membrane protein complex subunit 4